MTEQLLMNGKLNLVSRRSRHMMRSDLTHFFSSFFRELDAPSKMSRQGFDLSIGNVCHIEAVEQVLKDALQFIAQHKVSRLTKYPGTQGYFPLNEKIAALIKQETGSDVDPEEIVLTNGALDSLYGLFYTFCNPGDYFFYSLPSFPYWSPADKANILSSLVIYKNPFAYSSTYGDIFAEKARMNDKLKMVIINEPHNPIGKNLEKKQVYALRDACQEHGTLPVLDDVYRSFNEGAWIGKHFNLNSLVMVDSFSKRFGMPGLRLGFIRLPKEYVPYFRASIANQVVGINMFTALIGDYVLEQALETSLVSDIAREIKRRQTELDKELRKLKVSGVVSPLPDGGIYRLLALDGFLEATGLNISQVTGLLQKNSVKTVPGNKLFVKGIDLSKCAKVIRLSVGGEARPQEAGQCIVRTLEEAYDKNHILLNGNGLLSRHD